MKYEISMWSDIDAFMLVGDSKQRIWKAMSLMGKPTYLKVILGLALENEMIQDSDKVWWCMALKYQMFGCLSWNINLVWCWYFHVHETWNTESKNLWFWKWSQPNKNLSQVWHWKIEALDKVWWCMALRNSQFIWTVFQCFCLYPIWRERDEFGTQSPCWCSWGLYVIAHSRLSTMSLSTDELSWPNNSFKVCGVDRARMY